MTIRWFVNHALCTAPIAKNQAIAWLGYSRCSDCIDWKTRSDGVARRGPDHGRAVTGASACSGRGRLARLQGGHDGLGFARRVVAVERVDREALPMGS